MLGKKKTPVERKPRLDYQRPSSYHYSAKRSQSEKLFDRTKTLRETTQKRVRHIPTFVAFFLIAGSLLYLVSLSASPQITVEDSGGLLRDRSSIEPKAQAILQNSFLNYNKITFQRDKVAAELQRSFPEFSEVAITTPIFRHRPHVAIQLAKPSVLISSGNRIYVLDESGRALFDTVKDKPTFDISGLPLVQDQSSHTIQIGKVALSSSTIAYIHEVVRQSEQKDLYIESLLLVNGGGELDVRYRGLHYYIKMNIFEDARKSTGTFIATKEKLEADNAKPNEYIDVRIPSRAYVK